MNTLWIRFKTWLAGLLNVRNPKDFSLIIGLTFDKGIAEAQVRAQRFLLENAAMVEFQPDHFKRATTPYAYIHPKTWNTAHGPANSSTTSGSTVHFTGSPTSWVITDLMPEGRVIYSPNAIPGIQA